MRERIGNYGWSPAQLARVNARRAARGQSELADVKMGDRGYGQKYSEAYGKYTGKKQSADDKKLQSSLEEEQLDEYCEMFPEDPRCKERRLGVASTSRLNLQKQKQEELDRQRNLAQINKGMSFFPQIAAAAS